MNYFFNFFNIRFDINSIFRIFIIRHGCILFAPAFMFLMFIPVFCMILSSPAAAKDDKIIGKSSSEVIIYFKNAASFYDGFINSNAVKAFNDSGLGARYDETIVAGKIAQLKKAVADSFKTAPVYKKALDFFDCSGALYVVESDLDSLLLTLVLERDINKFEYFIKLKKGVKTKSCNGKNYYVLSSSEGVDSLYFASYKDKTVLANNLTSIEAFLSGRVSLEPLPAMNLPLCVYINLKKLNAKVSDIYKNIAGQFLFFYNDVLKKEIKIVIFNGEQEPSPALVDKAMTVCDKVDMPQDMPMAVCLFDFDAADFFEVSVKYAEKFEMPAELTKALKVFAGAGTKGAGFVVGASGEAISARETETEGLSGGCGALLFAGLDKSAETQIKILEKYLSGLNVEYDGVRLKISSSAGACKGEMQRALDFNSINRLKASYFYYIKFDDNIKRIINKLLDAALAMPDWQGSNAYELTRDIKNSPAVIDSIYSIFAMNVDDIEKLNSIIVVKYK